MAMLCEMCEEQRPAIVTVNREYLPCPDAHVHVHVHAHTTMLSTQGQIPAVLVFRASLCVYCMRFINGYCDLLNALSLHIHTEVDYDYERLLRKLLGSPSDYHNIVK
jgi:hypothetical protein